jgi:hypothetical protein
MTDLGKIPVRTEITVLPADDTRETIGWTVREYSGCDVFLLLELEMVKKPITDRHALKPGVSIAVPSFFRGCHHHMKVQSESYAETLDGKLGAFLRFGEDDRNCWVCTSLINTKVFKAIQR